MGEVILSSDHPPDRKALVVGGARERVVLLDARREGWPT